MRQSDKILRDDLITEALAAVNEIVGDAEPTGNEIAIFAALKRLRDPKPVRLIQGLHVDYLEKLQNATQQEWMSQHGSMWAKTNVDPTIDATAAIDTPLGRFTATTWRRRWASGKIAWASEYSLNGEPITISEIRAAGLAQRPTIRNRQKRTGE